MAKKQIVRSKRNTSQPIDFNDRLILFKFFLSAFGSNHLTEFKHLNHKDFEGYDENGNTFFYRELNHRIGLPTAYKNSILLKPDKLKEYDENIIRHLKYISEKRGNVILKYFQYFSLLFTEIFLDRFFNDSDDFVKILNYFIDKHQHDFHFGQLDMEYYTKEKLNKLGFMCATGSGKTLIMHINILQFRHYNKLASSHYHGIDINKTILLSPNEGMSLQHLEEFKKSNIPASLFQKNGYGFDFTKDDVLVIDMNKLKEEGKVKTVSVDSFEQNNLVLIDEAHRGIQGDVWSDFRSRLSAEGGFSFEYSATFKQALRSLSATKKDELLLNEYGKSIIMDYSYKYFYSDGYGKDYRIYNLTNGLDNDEQRYTYLTGCLLSFFQQIKLFELNNAEYSNFRIEKPLLIFVGNRVTAPVKYGSSLDAGEKELLTDIEEILVFLSEFLGSKKKTIERIKKVIEAKTNIVDSQGSDLFFQNLNPLSDLYGSNNSAELIFLDILKSIFNIDTQSDHPRLELINLKEVGEIGIRVGSSGNYFGVVSIGDTSALIKKCEEKGLVTSPDEFSSQSLFRTINSPSSAINILIGSRKFTEGWNCYRVSTMGLINFAKGEGSQAIQLFGRGVRLHGYGGSLKRSSKVDNPPSKIPNNIFHLETLTIFGLKADYMAKFREYLETEDLKLNSRIYTYKMPTANRFDSVKDKKLKVLGVKKGVNFKRQSSRIIFDIPRDQKSKEYFTKINITLDCQAKVQAITSPDDYRFDDPSTNEPKKIPEKYIKFIDFNFIYWQLQRYKSEKKYYNLSIDLNLLPGFLHSSDWNYGIIVDEDELSLTSLSLEKSKKASTYFALILQSYMDKFFTYHKNIWEAPYLVYKDLSENDANFVKEYTFTYSLENDADTRHLELEKYISELSELIKRDKALLKKEMKLFSDGLITFEFQNHLYSPLVYKKEDCLTMLQITPVNLNKGEKKFIYLLNDYLEENKASLVSTDIFLLRNKSRSGIGFFEAGNFYPDFILWIDTKDKQFISFIDPKGLVYHTHNDPKITFHKKIKELEKRDLLQETKGSKDIILNSFIFSSTGFKNVRDIWELHDSSFSSPETFSRNHILFLDDEYCIKKMFDIIH